MSEKVLLSRVQVGDCLLTSNVGNDGSEYPIISDRTSSQARKVESIEKRRVPGQTGYEYVLTFQGGLKSEPRFGTSHWYKVPEPAKVGPKAKVNDTPKPKPMPEVIPQKPEPKPEPEPEAKPSLEDLAKKLPDGEHVTPKGRRVVIEDGKVKVVEDTGAPSVSGKSEWTPPAPTPKKAPARTATQIAARFITKRCDKCKGYGVVRKYGANKGYRYKTENGAKEATRKGNSMECPECKGAGKVVAREVAA